MKLLVLSTCDQFDTIEGKNILKPNGQHKALEDSLIKHGYDYEFFLYGFVFGEQYKVIKTFVDEYKGDATHILYCDMFDNVALAPPSEVIAKFEAFNCKMLISVEKACFPNDSRDKYHRPDNYPESTTDWKYINGGGCLFEIAYFKELCTKHPFNTERMMDPDWLAELYLNNRDNIMLDTNCDIFQCLAHSNRDEWEIEEIKNIAYIETINNGYVVSGTNRIRNKATQSLPIFLHGNGHTNMDWVYELNNGI